MAMATEGNLDHTKLYALLYISNLKTGVARQVGIVDGAEAERLLRTSPEPNRIRVEEMTHRIRPKPWILDAAKSVEEESES